VPRMKAYLEAQPRMAKMLRVERDAEGLIPLEQARRALEGNVVVVIDLGESGAPGL
jgi:outer membrane biosynthesis protein TonB